MDEVEIYFDNKIGIVAPDEEEIKKTKGGGGGEPQAGGPGSKYNILKEIEKRNKLEEKIKEQIEAFEKLIDDFFGFLKADSSGKRLISKIKNDRNPFTYSEKLKDFTVLYTQYTIRNRTKLNPFFLRETKGNLSQLFDDFERSTIASWKEYQSSEDTNNMAADPQNTIR